MTPRFCASMETGGFIFVFGGYGNGCIGVFNSGFGQNNITHHFAVDDNCVIQFSGQASGGNVIVVNYFAADDVIILLQNSFPDSGNLVAAENNDPFSTALRSMPKSRTSCRIPNF